MDIQSAAAALADLTGALRFTGASTNSDLHKAREILARCLLLDQEEPLVPPGDPFGLARPDEVDVGEFATILEICTRVADDIQRVPGSQLEFRAFRRAISTKTDLDEAGPPWAVGAIPSRTFGPFADPDARPFWFSVYSTPHLVPVARQGGGSAMLFVSLDTPPQPSARYELAAGSVWIAANALASGAPVGAYCGLRVARGSKLNIDGVATVVAGVIIVPPGATLRLDLELDSPSQPTVAGANSLHPGSIEAHYPAKARLALSQGGANVTISTAKLRMFGADVTLKGESGQPPYYQHDINRVLVPYSASIQPLNVAGASTLFVISGSGPIAGAAWALPVARVAKPVTIASGGGGLALRLNRGATVRWLNLSTDVSIDSAHMVIEPHGTTVAGSAFVDPRAGQRFTLWADRAFPGRRCSVELRHGPRFPLLFRIEADGSEALAVASLCAAHLDRPVAASGMRLPIRAPDAFSIFFVGAGSAQSLLIRCTPSFENTAFALSNGLLLAGSPSSFLLFGTIGATADALESGAAILQSSVFSVVPILPDPYADNLLELRLDPNAEPRPPTPRAVLYSRIRWSAPDTAVMAFRLEAIKGADLSLEELFPAVEAAHDPEPRPIDNLGDPLALQIDADRKKVLHDLFVGALGSAPECLLLLDVSSNADQFGVGFGPRPGVVLPSDVVRAPNPQASRLVIEGLNLVTLGRDLRVFTVPQFQWEPVWTVQNPDLPFPTPLASADDGGPTLLGMNSMKLVPIAPRPLLTTFVSEFQRGDLHPGDADFVAAAFFTLPFGMLATAAPLRVPRGPLLPGAAFDFVQPRSNELQVAGGLQVSLTAIDPMSTTESESPSLFGVAIQTRNGVDPNSGARLALSVIGDKSSNAVESAFNNEFGPDGHNSRIPITRIDFSGYGASLYSRWRNPQAQIAQTSEVRFDVVVGRTAYEVVQVRSLLYPWAVRVVRTITIQRTGGGGVYRRDSGWVAASDGVFQFPPHPAGANIETHPGVVRGVFNVRHIRDTSHVFDRVLPSPVGPPTRVRLAAVRFDCEVRLSDVIVGGLGDLVTSVDQVGYVQLDPPLIPLTPAQYAVLLAAEGPLGGPVDCVMDVGRSGQRMRTIRVGVATAPKAPGRAEFAAAAFGSLQLPKDGQWSLCRQPLAVTRECEPLEPHTGVPLVRQGLTKIPEAANTAPYRFAEPADLFADTSGRNIALLWSTGAQRLLFSRPRILKGAKSITSDTTPLLADAFSKVSAGGLFPAALTCLRVPFVNYLLDIPGEGQLRLVLPSATFAAQPVSGKMRRELSLGSSTRLLADYTNTRITVLLDSSAPKAFTYDETGVALVQEENGVHAKTSRGHFHASSAEAAGWTLEAEEFGPLFDNVKSFMPMFASFDLAGTLPPKGATAPLETTEEPSGPNPKIGLKISKDVPKGQPMYIGTTTGGKIEIGTDFQNFFSIEAVVGIMIPGSFPGGVYFKYEATALKRALQPGSDKKVKAGSKETLVLAIGVYKEGDFLLTPYPLQVNWTIFAGFAFTHLSKPGQVSVGVGITFVANGTVQYPPGEFTLAEVGVKVEGQGLIEFRAGDKFLILKGSLSIEITVAMFLDMEWEIAEGTIGEVQV